MKKQQGIMEELKARDQLAWVGAMNDIRNAAEEIILRERKATVKKWMQAVKNTLPAMAEKLETLRQNMIIFRYQLRHIATGKSK